MNILVANFTTFSILFLLMVKKSHIYMYNIYLIYKNIKLATKVTNSEDLSIQLDKGRSKPQRKNIYFQRIGFLSSASDFLITKLGFF